MNRRRVSGTVLATVATGAIAFGVVRIIQSKRQGIEPSIEDLEWVRELRDRLLEAEQDDPTVRAEILAAAYRDLRSNNNIIASKQLRRRLGRVIAPDDELADEKMVDLERLLEKLEEAV